MPNTPLKLYIFRDVLTDWTSGIAFAIAPSVREARDLINDSLGYISNEIEQTEPEEHTLDKPLAGYCYGGG